MSEAVISLDCSFGFDRKAPGGGVHQLRSDRELLWRAILRGLAAAAAML
jgi:hypothetical protein